MASEIIEGEIIEAENVTRLPAVMETVRLPVSVDQALAEWEDYQRLTRELLNDTDYQKIGNKSFKKKSAWRKYARAFNITDRVTFEEIVRFEDGFPRFARIRVEARAQNGRTAEADHECHVGERCCENPCKKARYQDHTCCQDCDGRKHWSHPGDIGATALTRAKNRAISDLIGAGEVSAEEMDGQRIAAPQQGNRDLPTTPPPSCPEHGTKFMQLVKGGTSKAGREYDAFWSCKRDCKAGKGGKGFTRDAAAHEGDLYASRGEPVTRTAEEMDVPFDE